MLYDYDYLTVRSYYIVADINFCILKTLFNCIYSRIRFSHGDLTIEYSVSHVLFRCTFHGGQPRTAVVIIYLQTSCLSLFQFNSLIKGAPTKFWVAHSWGLPRSTRIVSNPTASLWHFQVYSSMSKELGFFTAVSHTGYLDLCFRQARSLQASQLV